MEKINGVTIKYDPSMADKIKLLMQEEGLGEALGAYKECAKNNCHKPDSKLEALKAEMLKHVSKSPFGSSCGVLGNRCKEFMAQWTLESKSTVYWVRFICHSVLVGAEQVTITLTRWSDTWEECEKEITFPPQQVRVVMGMGPSGCGKSTVAEPVFKWFNLATVVSIDGGISRDVSIVWNVATVFNQSNGIKDLYKLFHKHDSKGQLFQLVRGRCSLYVPVTLTASSNVSKYTKLDPNWIGLIIWQHLNTAVFHSHCDFPEKYKCVGCDVSGKRRAKTEGKKYDSWGYQPSMYRSMAALKHSRCKFIIHNSGQKNHKSVVAYDVAADAGRNFSHPMFEMIKMRIESFNAVVRAMKLHIQRGGRSRATRRVARRGTRYPTMRRRMGQGP